MFANKSSAVAAVDGNGFCRCDGGADSIGLGMANHRREPCHSHRDRLPLLPLFRGLRRSHFFTNHVNWFMFIVTQRWCDQFCVCNYFLFALWAVPGLFHAASLHWHGLTYV